MENEGQRSEARNSEGPDSSDDQEHLSLKEAKLLLLLHQEDVRLGRHDPTHWTARGEEGPDGGWKRRRGGVTRGQGGGDKRS